MNKKTSKKFTLDFNDVPELFKNAALVGAAAVVTYLAANLGELDLGAWTGIVVPVIAVALDTLGKWLKDNAEED